MGLIHCTLPAFAAEEAVLNLYSARHYATDEALYENFTRSTGIKINRVDADDAGILARLKAEGAAYALRLAPLQPLFVWRHGGAPGRTGYRGLA